MAHSSEHASTALHVPSDEALRAVRSVLFVCLGNICRSPTAHGVLEHLARERGVRDRLRIESCGTGSWHVGELPDPRTRATALKQGVELVSRARVIKPARDFLTHDLGGFDLILAMDRQNLSNIRRLGAPVDRSTLFRVFDPLSDHGRIEEHLEVPDPYDDAPPPVGRMFDEVFEMVRRTSAAMLDRMFR